MGTYESGIPGDHSISGKTHKAIQPGRERLGTEKTPGDQIYSLVNSLHLQCFGDKKEKTETIGSWPLGRTEPADPSELRVRGRVAQS